MLGRNLTLFGNPKEGISLFKKAIENSKSADADNILTAKINLLQLIVLQPKKEGANSLTKSIEKTLAAANSLQKIDFLNAQSEGSESTEMAINFANKALNIAEVVYGAEHPVVARQLERLASFQADLKLDIEALKNMEKAFRISEKYSPPDDEGLFHRRFNYAETLLTVGRRTEALEHFTILVEQAKDKRLGENGVYQFLNIDYVTTLSELNKYSKAIEFANSNIEDTITKFEAMPKLGRAMYLTRLSILYDECGDAAQVARLIKKIDQSIFVTDPWISETLAKLRKKNSSGTITKSKNCQS